jgi:hypothetical protein
VIDERERAKMKVVRLRGERVIARLESIGTRRLADLAGCDPWRPIWRAPMAVVALQNLVDAAEREASPPAQPVGSTDP